ncbi:response regulator [Vibrio sp. JPW-9-11-11]|uniref:ATP-binding protein n=1 Tax=Vibrio sp. JPW-9-11-11 TaxID=1416532 RepID=UPI0015930FD9|nr:ATP-binding protein [Vibrio sp. JPW-9-11-11]NVD06711.1 response regulator [Vibrio sp. JPW-9-11-11]
MTLRSKTILGIALIEICVLIVLVFSAMRFMSESNEKQLLQRVQSSAVMFVHAAKDAVLSTDIATLEDLVNEFITLEDVAYVRVIRNGKAMAMAGEEGLLRRPFAADDSLSFVDDGIYDLSTEVISNDQYFARIEMGFETAQINNMLDEAQQAIIGIAIIEVMLVALVSFLLGTYLTRRLTQLTSAVKTLGEQGPGFQLKQHSKDELGQVSQAFDEMSAKLEKDYHLLMQARQGAEQANDSKSRFLASMSHEIRTPMNGVLGILNILEETELSAEQRKLVSTATESGHFLLSVINDILDFTRMESNTLILEDKPFDFRHCVESVVDSFSPAAVSQHLVLHCYFDGDVPDTVRGDQNRVKQILLNLLGNAFKFTHEGSVTIKIASRRLNHNKVRLQCEIRDTGIGIDRHALEYLFDEFTMVDQTYSRSKEGSGLGLAICRRLCHLMDGDISVESKPNAGSTFSFHICLPLCDELATLSVTEDARPLLFPSARILVAEDNRANQLVIREMFKRLGLDIDIAQNGIEVLEMVKNYQYDLIFMDISMPKMDGMKATAAIRALADSNTANLPIVALTAHSLAGDKEKFLAAGMNDYLSKPLRLSQLVEKINLFLNKHSTTAQLGFDQMVTSNKQPIPYNEEIDEQSTDDAMLDLVDEAVLQQMIEDTSADIIPMLIDHYLQESQQRLDKIYQAIDTQDKETLEFEAHTLGSSSLALGNRALSRLARQMEHLCLEGSASQAYQLKQQLEHTAIQSLQALALRKQQGFSEPSQQ